MADMTTARDLIRAVDIVAIAKEIGLDPDEKQRQLLTSTAKEILLVCTRQWGKSSMVALKALHHCLYPGDQPSMCIIISPSDRQSFELHRKVSAAYGKLLGAPKVIKQTLSQTEWENGGRLISLPSSEETVRGYSAVTLLICDESGNVPEEMIAACEPMLATTSGQFLALGTPKGKRGWFYEAWSDGEGYEKISARASECSRIRPEWLARQLKKHGPLIYSQEFECAWIDSGSGAFSTALIERCFRCDFELF